MKRPSDFLRILLVLAAALCGVAQAGTPNLNPADSSAHNLFAVVPAGDPTYVQLQKLAGWGFLPKTSVDGSLTRYEVADLILRARRSYDESKLIKVAQADLDLSDPEATVTHRDKSQGGAASADGNDLGLSDATSTEGSASKPEDVEKTFTTLQQAYDYELNQVKSQVKDLQDRVSKLDEQNYKIWKQVRTLSTTPSISVHGFGRSWSWARKQYGNSATYPLSNIADKTDLDLVPTGVISKELSWDAILRLHTQMEAGGSATTITLQRLSIKLTPDFMSTTLGDFDLSWTPFTLWNRDCDNDYLYTPGVLERWNRYEKSPYFVNNPPDWPLRGVRIGTAVMWPNSSVLDSFKVEAFAHMLRTGYSSGYVAFRYTGWMFGAMSEIKAKKYLTLDAYGLMLDEPLDSDDPAAVYKTYGSSTWAQRYSIGSLAPKLAIDLNDNMVVGANVECAGTNYWDDKTVTSRKVQDWSTYGGPYLKYKTSTVSVNYLNVGYGFYSPMAQLRERDDYSGEITKHPVVLSNDIGIDALGRPSALFKYYNRATDNVFPYGLATPNRRGFGGDFDFKALQKDALSFKAKVYAVEEITDNFVVNKAGTSFESVDKTVWAANPKRKFVYVNVGPQLDIASLLNVKRRLDAGFNVRSESTKSDIGTLNSTMFQVGVGVGIKSWLDFEVAGRVGKAKGREATLDGAYARTAYPYDNTDLGKYIVTDFDGIYRMGAISFIFKIDKNSKLFVDAALEKTPYSVDNSNITPAYNTGLSLHKQTLDVIYEITF